MNAETQAIQALVTAATACWVARGCPGYLLIRINPALDALEIGIDMVDAAGFRHGARTSWDIRSLADVIDPGYSGHRAVRQMVGELNQKIDREREPACQT